ncbi:MAG: chorismate-binding protein, partial [Candidatus Humimicrobiaceae bacterium]
TGSIGYIGVDGNVDLNIVIRTFIIKNENFYYNTGGGIVEDSDSEEEYLETLQKGKALEEALKFFEYENLSRLKE